MPLPTNVGTGTVIWSGIDSSGVSVSGEVIFTPSPVKLLNVTATPVPVTILPKPVTATLVDGALSQVLVATDDPDNNPSGWTYKVTFKLGNQLVVPPFDIAVPEGTTVDLSVVAPVSSANGVTITRGEGVPTGGTTGQVLAKVSNADDDTDWVDAGGGAVDSVNGATGVVMLDADDIPDGATKVTMTSAERTKLSGVATGATANATDAQLRDRSTHTGAQAQSTVTNLTTDLAAKAPLASPAFTGTPTGITKTHVGLGNVDNTSDVNKPVSTATQTALDGKSATGHTHEPTDITTEVGATFSLALLPPGSRVYVVKADDIYGAAGSWPVTRPTSRTDLYVTWEGDTDPGSLALDFDHWDVR